MLATASSTMTWPPSGGSKGRPNVQCEMNLGEMLVRTRAGLLNVGHRQQCYDAIAVGRRRQF